MGDVVFEYVQMANAPPVAKFTDASAGQTTVIDNIFNSIDVIPVVVLNNPRVIEFSSPTVEVGQSFVSYVAISSLIVDRILFESTESRMAFMVDALSSLSRIPPALGIPVEPEMEWRNDTFVAGIQATRDAINEIESAPDVQIRDMLKIPRIRFIKSPTVRVNETVIWIDFPESSETIKVHMTTVNNETSFIHKFILPLATATAIIQT